MPNEEIEVLDIFSTGEPSPNSADDLNDLVEETRERITTFSPEVNAALEKAEAQLHSNDATMWDAVQKFGQPNHTDTSAMAVAKALMIAGVEREVAHAEMLAVYSTQYDDQASERAVNRVISKAYDEKNTGGKSSSLPYNDADLKEGCLDRLEEVIADVEPLQQQEGEHQKMSPLDFVEELDNFQSRLWCVSGALSTGEFRAYKHLTTANIDDLRDKFSKGDNCLCHVVTNPMTAATGKTQEGKASARCKENSTKDGQDIAITVEMDTATEEQQLQFAQYLIDLNVPVIWVAHSGSKSIHTRVSTVGLSPQQVTALKCWVVKHGADPNALRTHQLVRLPNALREVDGESKTQTCLYFDSTKIDANFPVEVLESLGASTKDLLTEKNFDEELLYNQGSKAFYHKNAQGEYFADTMQGYRLSMKEEGVDVATANTRMHNAKMHNSFKESLEVAGWRRGIKQYEGQRYFVPVGYRPPSPQRGDWSITKEIVENLFGQEQLRYLYSQMQEFAIALIKGIHSQFAAIAICGEASSGKTLFVDHIFATVVNARKAQGETVIKGNTDFNSDLIGAEIITLDDVKGSFGKEAKAIVTAEIKKQVATSSKMIHAKGKDKLPVEPTQILIMSLNLDDEDLAILPNVGGDGKEDKFSVYRVNKHKLPMPTNTVERRQALKRKLKEESPAFLHFLLYEWETPEDVRSDRFITYHSPDIYERLLDDETKGGGFVEIVNHALWVGNDKTEVEGTANEIAAMVIAGVEHDKGWQKIAHGYTHNAQTFARNLSKAMHSEHIEGKKVRKSHARMYTLTRPEHIKPTISEGLDLL